MFNTLPIIPSYVFNNQIVFISNNSFKQNKSLANIIRRYINENINLYKAENITTIGGEAYLIGLTNNKIKGIINYTNSKSIYNDVRFNNNFYKKINENNLIDYNICNQIKTSDLLLINLAKLNQNLMKVINNCIFKKIIIINCHHNDFWKKIKLLSSYKLISRKQFITNKTTSQELYFITINIFILKPPKSTFISLGGNCSIAYQLKRLGLRHKSYPFDWCKMSINKLNKVLENDFENFSDIKIFKFSKNHLLENDDLLNDNGSYIVKNKYNISFAHELKTDTEKELKKFKETLERRITRFKNLNADNLTFIILNLENKQNDNLNAEILTKNLKIYFNNFKLVYIGPNIDIKNKENKEIKYIKLNINEWVNWQYSNLDWNNIFT